MKDNSLWLASEEFNLCKSRFISTLLDCEGPGPIPADILADVMYWRKMLQKAFSKLLVEYDKNPNMFFDLKSYTNDFNRVMKIKVRQ